MCLDVFVKYIKVFSLGFSRIFLIFMSKKKVKN